MNIENLYVGQTFKNYKELCLELDMEIKTSTNSKKSQLKELARYCKFNKVGYKFAIEKIYDNPLPKIDNRANNNSIYGNLVQLLITDLLAQCNGHVSISRSKLMLTIGMINCNYSEGRELVRKLAQYCDIDEKVIYDFYNTSSSSFRSVIETALNSLMNKRIIMYNRIIKISEKDIYSSRNATKSELELIMDVEKEILEELGYFQISSVRISNDWKTFKAKTKKLLHERSNIDFYFTAYDIVINEKYIIKERNTLLNLLLEQVKRKKCKDELNKLICVNLLNNAQKRHKNGFTAGKRMSEIRQDDNYLNNIKQLVDLLIDKNTPNLLYKIRAIELEDELPPEIEMEIDSIFG